MSKRLNLRDFKAEALKNARVREEYESLRPEFELLMEFINARKAAKISQEDLARKLKVQQPSIARLENGGYSNTVNPFVKTRKHIFFLNHRSLRKLSML